MELIKFSSSVAVVIEYFFRLESGFFSQDMNSRTGPGTGPQDCRGLDCRTGRDWTGRDWTELNSGGPVGGETEKERIWLMKVGVDCRKFMLLNFQFSSAPVISTCFVASRISKENNFLLFCCCCCCCYKIILTCSTSCRFVPRA